MELFAQAFDPASGRVTLIGALFAALVGLTSSVHCFAMCGPLACAACPRSGSLSGQGRAMATWQLSRVLAYALVGAALGAAGGRAASALEVTTPKWLPWVLAATLVASALGLTERVPRLPLFARMVRLGGRKGATLAPLGRSALLGALTPLLPCGLLYGLYATALVSGGAVNGALLAGGFALGAIPALLLAQLQAGWSRVLPAGAAFVLRRGVPLVAAGMLVWRALATRAAPLCH